jgi:protein phosphatase PTC7
MRNFRLFKNFNKRIKDFSFKTIKMFSEISSNNGNNPSTQNNKFNTKIKHKFTSGVVKIPHFTKLEKGGEDAYAIHDGMICVADGVGGWNESGIDPSKYSKELSENVYKEFLKNGNKLYSNPKQIFKEAAFNTKAIGSSTFCMCVLDLDKNYIYTVNLGDSGYMILRPRSSLHSAPPNSALKNILNVSQPENPFQLIFKSEEQTHSFNFPYQVGTNGDSPNSAITNVHQFEEDDIIILATDGLWDNLFENQIMNIIKPFVEKSTKLKDVELIADMIGQFCERDSLDQTYKSPFCKRSGGLYLGGKPDDITIIVAQIVKNDI